MLRGMWGGQEREEGEMIYFNLFFLNIYFLTYLFIICKYTIAVFRHSRREYQILLRMVVSHHVVVWI